jgi:hypothetical protein
MSFDFFPNEQGAALLNAARHPSTTPEPGAFDNFVSGAGRYTMRSLAEAGRAVSLAGAVVPMAIDKITEGDNFSGKSLTDRYFETHDEVFNNAVDYWTPKPGEVGAAGQIAGQLAGGVMQAIVSPALLVGTSALSPAEDLVREGVDASTATKVGVIQGAGAGIGLKMPFLGQTLATRVLSGAGGNLMQGTAGALASSEVLKAGGYDKQAEQFTPWDLRARVLDVMLGAAFGGLAHIDAKGKLQEAPKLTPTDEAALLVANQARHIEDATPQGRPATDADATMHADAMRQAVEQVLRGEQVTVDGLVKDMRMVPDESQYQQRMEVADEAQRIAAREAPLDAPILPKIEPGLPMADNIPAEHNPTSLKARQIALDRPDLTIPTNRTDADGNPITMRAADAIALADAEVAHAQAYAANVFKTAAHCLLGAL